MNFKPVIEYSPNQGAGPKQGKADLSHLIKGSLLAFVLCCLLTLPVQSQGLVKIIQNTQGATFQAIAYSSKGVSSDSATGFFISADGLAITPSSILLRGNSIEFKDFHGNQLQLRKVIALHPYAGLALIQLSNGNEKRSNYLIPSNSIIGVNDNILIFGNPHQPNEGLYYTRTAKSFFQLFLRRGLFIEGTNFPASLHGAPIINETGHFSGILYQLPSAPEKDVFLPVSLLTDTLWKSVNQTYDTFLSWQNRTLYCDQGMPRGLLLQSADQWIESAKAFSQHLKIAPDEADGYALRAISRLKYDNIMGCLDDIGQGFHIDTTSALTAYAHALYYLKKQSLPQADDQLRLALGTHPTFAMAFLELGKLQVSSEKIKEGYFSFSKAIESDTLLAEAYYEKARLTQKYSSTPSSALEDLKKAAQLNPFLPGVYALIGNIKVNTHDYLDAIRDFNQAIKMDPHDGHAYINRGLAWYNVGMKENACKDWEQAGKEGMPQAFKLLSRHCSELRKSFLQNR